MKSIYKTLFYVGFIFTIAGCGGDKEPAPVDCANSDLSLSVSQVIDASCNSEDGSIVVSAGGGEGPFEFRIGSGTLQSSNSFNNLPSGVYQIFVRDTKGCETSVTANVLTENSTIAIDGFVTTDSGCKDSQGSVTVSASGGEGSIQYSLNNGSFQSDNLFQNIPAGVHDIVVKDEAGCEVTGEVQVLSGVSFDNQVKSIISANCAISGCHDGSNSTLPNWTVFTNVQNQASNIKSRIENGTMPPAGSGKNLTQEQKDLIACWVDDGALDN